MKKSLATRQTILEKAFEHIYKKGYQPSSIDEIIATTKVTKGAFYYHFKTKDEMGLAIINEIVTPIMKDAFIKPLDSAKNPIKAIYEMTRALLLENELLKLEYGCPIGNLAQEMTPWNIEFDKAIAALTTEWKLTIENSIKRGKVNGTVRKNINTQQVAFFIMSGYWGIRNFGKIYNNTDCYISYLKELKSYLNSLS